MMRRTLPQASPRISSQQIYAVFKRSFDVLISSLLLVGLAPLMALIALIVRLSSRGPTIFSQQRVTRNGEIFTMYKFRTMVVNAEGKTGAVWARRNDPRVTFLGRFLRATRLDELPQLFNVLKGEMSMIGPRPERPELVDKLALELPGFSKRLQVKAGLTGLAQVAAGYADSVDSYRKKLAWDIVYIQKRSILLDLLISFKTVAVVFTGRGAR